MWHPLEQLNWRPGNWLPRKPAHAAGRLILAHWELEDGWKGGQEAGSVGQPLFPVLWVCPQLLDFHVDGD